ncbi:MAG: PKD domain-containing protein [Candidatus Lokiarchaeota archaeon]|nr:PKD domain-containing protein [Candidatus Lokiarchaeota archaeon]
MTKNKRKLKINKKHQIGITLIFFILMAEYANAADMSLNTKIEKFYTEDNVADVGEPIEFIWDISDYYPSLSIRILFGDGNNTLLTNPGPTGSYIYHYKTEGKYNATMIIMAAPNLYIWKSVTDPTGEDILINIINNPPKFDENDISFNWELDNGPYEDEEIQISINVNDSPIDLEEEKMTYIYDFGDGEQTISNQSQTTHIWTTAGTYPVSITAKDDQGALTQKTRYLEIKNKVPIPKFTLGAGIPATYSFTEDIIGNIPFGWNLSNTEGAQYAFEVIEEKNSHGKVLKVIGNESSSISENYIRTSIGSQDYGSIEYQYLTENRKTASGYIAIGNSENEVLSIFVENEFWKYRLNGYGNPSKPLENLMNPKENTWYHIRLDFCIDNSEITPKSSCYGLVNNQFRVSIDGSSFTYNFFQGNNDPISYMTIGNLEGSLGNIYIDSIGLSWDDEYNVGDNFNVYTPEYYGTYDWREGTIGSRPNGWEVHSNNIPSRFKTEPFYIEDFNTNNQNWDLYDVDERIMNLEYSLTDDAYVNIDSKNSNYGNSDRLDLDIREVEYSIPVFNGKTSNANYPAITEITIPDLPFISSSMYVEGYCDSDDSSSLRALYFDVDDRGGAIGTTRIGPGQVRGYGTIERGETTNWNFDMTDCQFAVKTGTGHEYLNFLPQNSGQTTGYFSPGKHIIKAFISSQGENQDSWITITINFKYKAQKTETYIKKEIPYLTSNVTDNSLLDIYVSEGNSNSKVKIYSTSDFSENSITWNNRPSVNELLTTEIKGTGWNQFDLGSIPYNYYCLKQGGIGTSSNNIRFYSSEYQDASKRPKILHFISKNYQGKGILYCQTDKNERLTLRSSNNQNTYLRKGDKIDITFKTTSPNEILFNLIDTVGIKQSYEISPEGNSNSNLRTISLTVQDDIYIDYMEFTGLFEARNNLVIDSIKFFEGIRSSISYIDVGNDFGKVIQINDRSTKNELWMENYFESQSEGIIEFWVRTSDAEKEVWSLSFYNSSSMIFKFSTLGNIWKYSFDGNNFFSLSELRVEEDQWNHVRIHFNNSTKNFDISINNRESISIENIEFDEINKISFSTKKENEGLTLIDAIGYSWDEYYSLGENMISLVLYPEKTNIQFSAADSIDTVSDYDSLKYYWDFGDGTSGYGKYVSHDYLTSGNYIVTLVCKDDNGATNSLSQVIKVYNTFPEIYFTDNLETIAINEGETVFFNAESWDEITDFSSLRYSWVFDPINNDIFDFENSIEGGWRQTHIYNDDYYGKFGVMVQDTEGDYNYDFSKIFVRNVDPMLSIYDAYMIANISFEVIRSSPDKSANFTFELLADDLSALKTDLCFNNSNDISIRSEKQLSMMSLSKNWQVNVYSPNLLPQYSWFRYNVNLEYLDGTNITITSGKIYGNDYGEWSLNLNPYWINSIDNTFKHPISFDANVFDPSVDDIFLDITYDVDMLIEITCSNNVPIMENYVINQILGDVSYTINIYEEDGKKFANIHATQLVYENSFDNNDFPTQLEINFNIFPIIDLELLLIDSLGLENLEIVSFVETMNSIKGEVLDDDGGSNEQTVDFASIFEFSNLSPSIEILVPDNETINTEVSFLVKIEDFNQLDSEIDFDIQDVIEDDIPSISEDFDIVNGTIEDITGDLEFNDDEFISFSSDYDIIENIAFFDDFNDNIRASNWTDDSNFGRIKEDDGVLKLKTTSFSLWQNYSRWFFAWAPYCKIPLSLFSTEWWEITVNVSKHSYSRTGNHHYGLMIYENEKNVWMFGPTNDGKIKITKIIEGKAIDENEIISNDTNLRIRKINDVYYFEHSSDGDNWSILMNINSIEINATDAGLFHRVSYSWCDHKHCYKSYKTWENKHCCKSYKTWENKHCCKSYKKWNHKHCDKSYKKWNHKDCYKSHKKWNHKHCYDPYMEWVFFDNFSMVDKRKTDHILNFTTNLDLESIESEQVLKYLQINSDYKTDSNQLINISIFNFQKNTWELIDSNYIDNEYYHLNYTIPSLEYLDMNNQIHLRFEAVNSTSEFKLFLDKLQLEYCASRITNYQSEKIPFSGLDIADQNEGDISLNEGTIINIGDLSVQDNNYATYESIYTEFNSLAFISKFSLEQSNIDDRIASITLSYSFRTNIDQLVNISVYNYTSQQWVLFNSLYQNEFNELSFEFNTDQTEFFNSNEIYIKFEAKNNLNSFTLDLDLLRVDYTYLPHHLISDNIRYSEVDFNEGEDDYAIFNSNEHDFEFTLNMPEMSSFRTFNLGMLYYSIKSSVSQEMNLYLYNFSGGYWSKIDTFIVYDAYFYSGDYLLENSDYISSDNSIKIKFEGTIQDEYELFVENIGLIYKWSEVWGQYGSESNRQDFISLGFISNEYNFVYWDNTSFYMNGDYLIIITADDGYNIIQKGEVINIINQPPFATIGPIKTGIIENEEIRLTSELFYYGEFAEETRFEWSFGDDLYAYEQNPTHYWSRAGTYDITLTITDCFGNSYTDTVQIQIDEQPPEILGPYSFYGIQGQAVVLDVEIYDSFYDEMNLIYEWYSVPTNEISSGQYLFSTDKKPVVFLNCGNYTYSLIVIDPSGSIAQTNITIEVDDIPPVVSISSYMYQGNKLNTIDVKAYVYDSYLENEFKFTWTIQNDLGQFDHYNIIFYDNFGIISFNCRDTVVYKGEVMVSDPFNLSMTANFWINSFIDTNGNGFSDEIEAQLAESGHTIWDAEDSDEDGYSDVIEEAITGTSIDDPDCDDDGLYDGTDSSTGFGELTFGTDPWDPDSDDDDLEDGFEVFGWNITVNSNKVYVSSNPILPDTDNDGLSDYEEFIMKFDPRTADTDSDGLVDTIDPYPIHYDYDQDGLSDFEELRIGTDLNNSDTDGDSLTDGQEVNGWHFKTNPLSQDSDHDLLSDGSEIMSYKTNIKYYSNKKYIGSERVELEKSIYLPFTENIDDAIFAQLSFTIAFGEYGSSGSLEYGIEDVPNIKIMIKKDNLVLYNKYSDSSRYISETIDIKEIIEKAKNIDYYGNYILSIDKKDSNCILEDFNLEIARYLDPNDADFDNDGILDGVETQLVVRGTDKIDFKDYYLNGTLTNCNTTEPIQFNEYSLDISSIGRIYDADLHLEIESDNILYDDASINIELIKEEIDNRINDPILISYSTELPRYNDFRYSMDLDLKNLLNTNRISEFYGKYYLKILIISDSKIDSFSLDDFYIEIDTWIQAGLNDWKAWITDPAKYSTDKDGFSDKYEIDHGYNPLAEDTDGDGVWDHKDVDPLHNLVIEVKFTSGSGGSHLEAGFKMEKDDEELAIWTPYGDGSFGEKYYIDINDDRKEIDLDFYLYDMHHIDFREIITYKKVKIKNKVLHWLFGWLFKIVYKIIEIIRSIKIELPDTKLGHWNRDFTVGQSTTYNLRNGGKRLDLKVSTIALSRANTIAVYEIDSNFKNHYASQEKMNVFHLHVKDSGYNTPFVKGINTIVIPTRLFTTTILNSLIQDEKIDKTPLKGCEFSSVERDDSRDNEISSENIDFIIMQKDLTSAEAMEILNLILEIIINETTGETEFLYSYISTKEDNMEIEQMNVNIDILAITPYISNLQNSAQGEAPKGFWEAFLENLETLANLIISIVESIVEIIKNIIEAIESIAMEILSYLEDLIWILIRAAILILVWIMFTFTLIGFITAFIAMIPLMLIISEIIIADLIISVNSLKLVKGIKTIEFSYNITLKYISYFDIYVPTLVISMVAENLNYELEINFFSGFDPQIPMEYDPEENISLNTSKNENPSNVQTNLNYLNEIHKSSDSNKENLVADLAFTGFGTIMSMFGAVMSIHGAVMNGISKDKRLELLFFGLTLGAFVTSIVVLIKTIILTNDHASSFIWGLAWGCLITFYEIAFIFALGDKSNIPAAVGKFSAFIAAINIVANFGLLFDFNIMQAPATLIDLMAVGLGCLSILSVDDKEAKKRAMTTYTQYSFFLHLVLFLLFAFVLVIEDSTEENN